MADRGDGRREGRKGPSLSTQVIAGLVLGIAAGVLLGELAAPVGIAGDAFIRLLQMTTGMADVMQGALNSPYEGVGQSQMKADFGSIRVQSLQDQFATFAGDLPCADGQRFGASSQPARRCARPHPSPAGNRRSSGHSTIDYPGSRCQTDWTSPASAATLL